MRRCLLVHQEVAPEAGPDEQDTLAAASAVAEALAANGWAVERLAIGLDLRPPARRLAEDPPALVFNLVESLPGVGAGGPAALAMAALLEGAGVRFTGSGLSALALSSDKPAAKRVLRAAGVRVPPGPEDRFSGPFILKHRTEHGSFGLGPHSVVAQLPEEMPEGWFAEAFLPGREFNVSLLEEAGVLAVLAVAELVYAPDWPAGMPRILDYAGKWRVEDPLYGRTARRFGGIAPELAARIEEEARRAAGAIGLRGYGRVDLRLDEAGMPHVLEVNANPALAPDAGFAAAAGQAGIGFSALIGRIASVALAPGQKPRAGEAPKRELRREAKKCPAVALRRRLVANDEKAIGALCRATGFFSPAELAVAEELAREALGRGDESGYRFLLAEQPHGLLLGYACFGPVPASEGAWDLYWLVVHPAAQGAGLGRGLAAAAASEAAREGGRRLYAETSGRALYAPTRAFYRATGFSLEAVLADFYAPAEAKQIWALKLSE
ncbi:MAG TPA: GNAT family N-acetyltransferase [Acetobacteraceae bacterium]|nr:GNAT family N-acetyltransferase [Acetobacteraceae bacterium]